MDSQLKAASLMTLQTCMGAKAGELLTIVADDDSPEAVVQNLYQTAQQLQLEVLLLTIPPRQFHGQELPATVAAALQVSDLFLGPTSKSFSHTDARRMATKKGVRGATLPGITEDMFIRLMQADYSLIQKQSLELVSPINAAKACHITADNGTDIHLELANDFEPDHGILQNKGEFGNLPAGEVMGAPTNANGIIVIDRMSEIITEPTKLTIRNNQLVEIEGNKSGDRLQQLLKKAVETDNNQNAYQLAELGIGLNPLAKITGNILEDEKVLNTCHFAFGDNTSYPGGSNVSSIHMDGIVIGPKFDYA